MTHIEQAMRLCIRLKDNRDGLKRLLGDRYVSHVAPYRAVMKGVASEHPELPLAEIALQLIKRMDAAGHDPMPFAAAFVDECESMDAK